MTDLDDIIDEAAQTEHVFQDKRALNPMAGHEDRIKLVDADRGLRFNTLNND